MRIVFIGAILFSEKTLSKLIKLGANVVGVCTLEKSHFNSDYVDLTPLSAQHKIPIRYSRDINSDDSISWIKFLSPDIIFCFGWSQLLKSHLLNIAPMGVLGYHPAALPSNRGRHPLIWALILDLEETASTFFFMDEGADSGDILSQRPITISENDNAGTLYQRITETALEQIEEFIPALASGNYQRLAQDHSKSNTWRKRGKNEGKIDWRMSANSIHNLVRGLSKPYVGAHFVMKEKQVKVWKTEVINDKEKNIEPGKVLSSDKGFPVIKTGENSIKLVEMEPVIKLQKGTYL